ncbi:uncharacterized protein LOC131885770 [Tigriopus californicus]|uniref:uncharacterized protein LOC131885770 n=1 Tax=Tigriopus californicus TaxID=6832 RepID=UPI0027DA6C1A|nr:uncharacterized protein LOC131885770 [Tigriopus californicus]
MKMACHNHAVSSLKYPTTYLKVCQLVLLFACLGLMRHYMLSFGGNSISGYSFYDRDFLGKMTVGSMILIALSNLLGILAGNSQFTLVHLLQYGVGSVLSAVSGSLVLQVYLGAWTQNESSSPGVALGVMNLTLSLLFSVDCFLMFRINQEAV